MRTVLVLVISAALVSTASAKNLQKIDDRTPTDGKAMAEGKRFQIYRTGTPTPTELESMICDQGITEMLVLSDTSHVEKDFNAGGGAKRCGGKKITLKYFPDEKMEPQNVRKKALDVNFLKGFEKWVEEAQKDGKKIAFRCNCGCHRTGRLAAFYEMKYLGKTPKQAMENMDLFAHAKNADGSKDENQKGRLGKSLYWKIVKRPLRKQVEELYNYIHTKSGSIYRCGSRKKFCVDMNPKLSPEGNATAIVSTNLKDPDDNGYRHVEEDGEEESENGFVAGSTESNSLLSKPDAVRAITGGDVASPSRSPASSEVAK